VKKQINILFTCAGRRVVLIEEFRRALKDLGVEGRILATDISGTAAAMKAADESFVVPPAGGVNYMAALEKIVRDHSVGLLVPLTDLDLRQLARRREQLSQLGCEVMIGSEDAVVKCRDKRELASFLSEAGLPAIRSFSLKQFIKNPFFPCFIKPVRGSAGKGAMKIKNRSQFDSYVELFGSKILIQEYIAGSEYTIDVLCDWQGGVRAVVPRQRLEIRTGEVDKAVTVNDQTLIEAARSLAQAFDGGMRGVFCCQCRRKENGEVCFFDVNPRFGGGVVLSIAAGADFTRYVLELVLGLDCSAEMGAFTPNLMMMRYSQHICCEIEDPSSVPGFNGPIVK
jgi:carbamoyl-phosphate synthase large subunit